MGCCQTCGRHVAELRVTRVPIPTASVCGFKDGDVFDSQTVFGRT